MVPSYTIACAARPPAPESGWSSADWRNVSLVTVAHFHPRSSTHRPLTEAKLLHSGEGLHIHCRVRDRYVRVTNVGFQAQVYKDSCAEFFVCPGGTGGYLNFEVNAGGSLSVSCVEEWTRTSEGFQCFRRLEHKWNDRIPRVHNLPNRIDSEISHPVVWSIQYMIPWSLFVEVTGHGRLTVGEVWTGNFYKCGDETSHPHWAAWSLIGEVLDFHAPERFGRLVFV
jgi:hypothetical protein